MSKKRLKKKHWRDAGNDHRCVICSKPLWTGLDNYVQGRRGAVCLSCVPELIKENLEEAIWLWVEINEIQLKSFESLSLFL